MRCYYQVLAVTQDAEINGNLSMESMEINKIPEITFNSLKKD